ncbi:putative transmembrane domain-containing P-type ATPase3 [Cryptosporidium canis]|uniref:Transmembrane domain-containing P-type ATPase3 n=1 Tax=Cryptosporidium canis TaxID=195482 RepID=A0A9D5DGX8_9CRYT|nr:putative transmembrane domain-containing P-type ATPase3 [Cryptosporidium canis]
MPSLFYGLLSEIMDPLTVFQLLVVASYTFQGYVLFAIKWVPMMIVSIFANIRTHFTNIRNVRKLAEMTGCDAVEVIRGGRLVTLKSSELVPGDIIHIYENSVVPCDLLLLSGSAVVNESMLTGESAEVLKMPISECESEKISPEDGPYSAKRYFLYAGTQVTAVYNNVGKGMALGGSAGSLNVLTSSTRSTDSMVHFISSSDFSDTPGGQRTAPDEPAPAAPATTALVIRTGISTLRGKIIRSILYPSKYSFGLYDQLPIAWLCLSVIVAIIIFKQGRSFSWSLFTFFFALGSMNSTFPLYLGVLNTLAQNVSSKRLFKNFKVKALIPTRIMLAGKLRIVCFDKTGTLTNDHLDFIGMSPIYISTGGGRALGAPSCAASLESGSSSELGSQAASYALSDEICSIEEVRDRLKLAFLSIRSCTSLSHSPTNFGISKDVVGSPREYYEMMNGNDTDKALFSITNSFFEKSPATERVFIRSASSRLDAAGRELDAADSSLEVLRIFPFDYNRRLMSVIVHCKYDDEYYLFTKGAPESVQKIYTGSIDAGFKQRLDDLSSRGYYLIMSGFKRIERDLLNLYLALNRNDIETDLIPLGLFLFENTVRKEAPSVLRQLVDSDILPVVVTGDSPLTGLNAALKLGIIDETYGKVAVSELHSDHLGSDSVRWRCKDSKALLSEEEVYAPGSRRRPQGPGSGGRRRPAPGKDQAGPHHKPGGGLRPNVPQ